MAGNQHVVKERQTQLWSADRRAGGVAVSSLGWGERVWMEVA